MILNPPELSQKQHALMSVILSYFIDHPEAKDTAEGVFQWWIPKGEVDYRYEDVIEALNELVRRGWLTKRVPAQNIFGLNKARTGEIQLFLRKEK